MGWLRSRAVDEAHKWETEALRESRRSRASRPIVSQREGTPSRADGDWVTLRAASTATGIPIGTLRKWARRESVPSYLESDGELSLRMVDLGAVRERARALGRTEGVPSRSAEPAGAVPSAEPRPAADERGVPGGNGGAESQPDEDAEQEAEVGPDVMIVQIDAWNKMLMQLGNLHEAGQQLAEARERAVKAETEVSFLRERLSDLKGAPSEQTPDGGHQTTPVPPAPNAASDQPIPEPLADDPPPVTTSFWRYVARGWRRRRR